MQNKKTLLALMLVSVVGASALLSGCDNAEQKKSEACTQARNDADDGVISHPNDTPEQAAAARKKEHDAVNTWETLKCHESDVIHH